MFHLATNITEVPLREVSGYQAASEYEAKVPAATSRLFFFQTGVQLCTPAL